MKKKITGILLLFYCSISHAQQWESAGILYRDVNVSIELEYKLNIDLCNTNNKPSKYRYIVTKATNIMTPYFVNWQMDYNECNGQIMRATNSLKIFNDLSEGEITQIDWTFPGYKIIKAFHNVTVSNSPATRRPYSIGQQKGEQARAINYEKQVFPNVETILDVMGGSTGLNGRWAWYKDSCGGVPIGYGKQLRQYLTKSSTFYVRAEGSSDTTQCVDAFIKVSENSMEADSISGTKAICIGSVNKVKLTANGGKLGVGSEWVWYKDDCSGPSIGKGRSIEVLPTTTTTYYLRAEGPKNMTVCSSFTVVVAEKSISARSIEGANEICSGERITLKANGGNLASDAKWIWYKDFIGDANRVGEGEYLYAYPNSSAVYIVRGEGVCGSTSIKSVNVHVKQSSAPPYRIANGIAILDRTYSKGTTLHLTISGGRLGDNARWVWYKNETGKLEEIGSGENVDFKIKKTTIFLVRSEGGSCGSSVQYQSNAITVYSYHNTKPHNLYVNIGLASSSVIKNLGIDPLSMPLNTVLTIAGKAENAELGWYLRGRYSINAPKAQFLTDNTHIVSSNQQPPSGNYLVDNRKNEILYGASGGFLFGPEKFRFLVGAGWGKSSLNLGVAKSGSGPSVSIKDEQWAKNTDESFEGIALEAGLVFKFGRFNLMLTSSTLSEKTANTDGTFSPHFTWRYFDVHAGLGFNF